MEGRLCIEVIWRAAFLTYYTVLDLVFTQDIPLPCRQSNSQPSAYASEVILL